MRITFITCAVLCCTAASAEKPSLPSSELAHPLYIGAAGGYGSTTWAGLVPAPKNQNIGMSTSTPIVVNEGGGVWGFFAGYEFGPHFALEANYSRYPKATVSFDEESIFAFENDGLLDLNSNTDVISIMAKIMLTVPRTKLRAYSSFGGAELHRWDDMKDSKRITPTFGLGLVYDISNHVMAELGFNYTAGFGESELNPVLDYMPFLYSGVFKLAYKF